MAAFHAFALPSEHESSDYGSDFDDDTLNDLSATAELQLSEAIALTSIEQDPVTEYALVRLRSSGQAFHDTIGEPQPTILPAELQCSEQRSLFPRQVAQPTAGADIDDDRSPLELFRTHPKKPLSVTDIVSPAWCEQQYLFSLSKHGRVRRTPAMKQGSAVHKVLEEQVHTTVKIEVKSREDMFGLKIWNVIQGLRTLRSTGLTRELEVWGLLDGQVINGIIDVVTNNCPDPAYEDKILQRSQDGKKDVKLAANQTTLENYFSQSQLGRETPVESSNTAMIYVLDVKTRQSRTVPAIDGRFRPTQMQLMLYHRLLTELAAGRVDESAVFQRYNLSDDMTFSDVFIAEMSRLDFDNSSSKHEDSVTELLAHNNLKLLWQLMLTEFAETISATSPLSGMLTAEFRYAGEGTLLGRRSFEFDAKIIDTYVSDELAWWKGDRTTRGVEIEEAFKCRICEFADDCSWRKSKVDEAIQRTRQKKRARETG